MSPDLQKRALSLGAGLLVVASLLFGTEGCRDSRDLRTDAPNPCTPCHGDAKREGSALDQAAPPFDLSGNTDTSSRGVGAHQIHLTASATHGKLECNECHKVPKTVDEPGHADDLYPAEIRFEFAGLAALKNFAPSYDSEAYTCSNSYCHRGAEPKWTAPRSSEEACGSCHGLPPEVVVVNASTGETRPHPQSKNCDNCHDNLVRAGDKWTFKDPSLHVNGTTNVGDMACNVCHGNPDNSAPPKDLAGNLERTAIGVGAHQEHLAGGKFSRAVECNECHVVPATVEDPGHLDDTTPNAEVIFSGVATAASSPAVWDRGAETCSGSWCHGPKKLAASMSPKWTSEAALGCTDCHGYPPPPPHPQMARCSFCHAQTVGTDNLTIIARELHVNGTVDHEMPMACNACHGSANNPAPPTDLAGNQASSAVGAHQIHLNPTSNWRRAVQCGDCHKVPQSVWDEGHFDTPPPAEITFSSVATGIVDPLTPVWNGTTCSDVYCHRAKLAGGDPQWTGPVSWTSDLPAPGCESCHGWPPPPPHFQSTQCELCHSANWTGTWFKDPALHINGKVDF
jgi:predicted CxxxxCH...CXXCH cytochrome family protein